MAHKSFIGRNVPARVRSVIKSATHPIQKARENITATRDARIAEITGVPAPKRGGPAPKPQPAPPQAERRRRGR